MNVFDLALDLNDKEWFLRLHRIIQEMNDDMINERRIIMDNVAKYYLNNFKVTSEYGEIRGNSKHGGLDLSNDKQGDPVVSLMPGRVMKSYYSKLGGYMVIIQQDDGNIAKYMHMQKDLKVKEGDKVENGTELGFVGNSGFSVIPHLHMQIEQNGEKIDPLKYLNELASAS